MKTTLSLLGILAVAGTFCMAELQPNTLTDAEKKDGWQLLWDGQTAKGWRSINSSSFPKQGWEIKDGVLSVLGQKGGDIITDKKYANFDLQLEFKLTPGANSGIKYFIDPEVNKSVGCEYQILDDAKHPDAKLGKVVGCRTLGALYDLIPPLPGKKVNAIGEWNTARILVRGAHVEHWLNGEKLLSYERGSEKFRAQVAESKFAKVANFGMLREGHILLQDHGNFVSYRKIKIRELPE